MGDLLSNVAENNYDANSIEVLEGLNLSESVPACILVERTNALCIILLQKF